MIDNSNSESYDPDMEPEYTLCYEPSAELTDELPLTEFEYLALLDDVEGWHRDEDGKWRWRRRHDPFEGAPDPQDVGI